MLQPRDLKGRNAISYARWSSGKQAQGDSLARQTKNAEAFCATFGLILDRQLVDDGVSAFKGGNLDLEASLGTFIADVKAGVIPSDTVLLLENLDRFSRIHPMDAQPVLSELLKTGLTLVTLQDQRVHTYTDYRANFASLMMSLMSMQAAYEYSAKLSHRVGEAWSRKAEKARAAIASGGARIKVAKVPFWIDRETNELNARAEDALLLFELAKEGHGQQSITQMLNTRGIPSPSGKTWAQAVVGEVLRSPAAYGCLVLKGEEVPGYFPALVSEAEWLATRQRTKARRHSRQVGRTSNLFSRMVHCGHCGSPMVLTSSKKGGAVWGYFTCTGKTFKRTECTAPNWRYDQFEQVMIDRIGFLAVPIPQDQTAPDLSQELAETIGALEAKRENALAGALDAETAETRKAFSGKADELTRQIEAKRREIVAIRENDARYRESAAAVVDFEMDQDEIRRLAEEDRKGAQGLISNLVKRIDLESDSKILRRAVVTMRSGYSHALIFDSTGEPD
ncbi:MULTISPECIES: recombinase family protein [unclassified Mesorhizobium]|uniref:recombinase family protein n=1 Tax=unclassified Mesorhizobium TaxID=325217 RepID=UPI000FCC687B|nr:MULTISPECIES: recombinase family protein [unclassified Mesorhizobium]RUU64216.1 recombinase family protein [Mesorhizobium sp. M7A.T.Ca.TU.009.01.1.1]RUU88148.1 recombinase family protein [Mesorhizobium sp. M7A.T.Ca.TU.009.01.1.2]RUT84334.1 recombinase family protein [Mesorhizobium sp. M7A.T.Ca.US.000.02.1.1]RUT93567.1 recombinase family protein [Mesorhizobium sp. M7A.T.Ca.US.000.02.2.1]RUU01114.1 recombinase family protein [Mesorhizobium sp. M7A.T.Ca.TU.009.02.1.1]